jgi:hypothetical protein
LRTRSAKKGYSHEPTFPIPELLLMSEPIKTGDLVVVIKPTPCGCKDSLGWTGCVERLGRFKARCSFCGAVWESASMLLMSSYYIHVSRVLRIPPLEELDDVKQDEEITA